MKIRSIAAAALIFVGAGAGAGVATSASSASAGTTLLQTVSKSEHIVSSRCYVYSQTTTTYFHWSSRYGWVRYPVPRITRTTGETCH